MTLTWTADTANPEGVASVSPRELHQAIIDSSVYALRHGVEVEHLDGLLMWATDSTFGTLGDQRDLRRRQLVEEIATSEVYARNARDNANRTGDEDLRDGLLADAAEATAKVRNAKRRLADLDATAPTGQASPSSFTAELDFFAHAIGSLAHVDGAADPAFAEAVARIIEFTGVDASDYPWVTFTFYLLIPAGRQVARLGPLYATVTNRAYPALLAPDIGWEHISESQKSQYLNVDGELILRSKLAKGLQGAGWDRKPAAVAASTRLPGLVKVLVAIARGTGTPEGIDEAFVDHIAATYTSPEFRWRSGRHLTVSTHRQQLNDLLLCRGGSLNMDEAHDAIEGTDLARHHLALFSTDQFETKNVPWPATAQRLGDWTGRVASGSSLSLIGCPHCGGWASKAIRAPEVPACVLCPDCRRMPVEGSPVFPPDYVEAEHIAPLYRPKRERPQVAPLDDETASPDELLTTAQCAALIDGSPAWIAKLCDRGDLPHVKSGRWRYVRRDDLRQFKDPRKRARGISEGRTGRRSSEAADAGGREQS